MNWSVVYERAIRKDGSLFFPERLSQSFLDDARRVMGTYFFANQYLNQIVPEGNTAFKQEWFKYSKETQDNTLTWAFIDPALSESDSADATALTVVKTDIELNWHVYQAKEYRINPSELVELAFRVAEEFKPQCIGIEETAFQKALLYMISDEMRRRGKIIPVKGVKQPTDRCKEARIMGELVPRFEWGHIIFHGNFPELEMQLLNFPRGAHDDLIDSLASIAHIATYPSKERKPDNGPNYRAKDYERTHIEALKTKRNTDDSSRPEY